MTIDVARPPRKKLRPRTCLYRNRAGSDPWFFDGSGAGRFDPTGSPGRGTCDWAEDVLGAWVEMFRTRVLLPERELAERAISVATLSGDLVVVDLTVRRGLEAGVAGSPTLPALPSTETAPIAPDLVERACRIFGYVVLPQPPA